MNSYGYKSVRNATINRVLCHMPKSFLQWRHYYKNRLAVQHWLKDDPFLLHIPKTGGTSISKSLGRTEPGHFTFRYLYKKYPQLVEKKGFYFVSRDPIERVISTYNYINDLHSKFGTSNIPEAYYAKDCDDFIINHISQMNVCKHYFLRPVQDFIRDIPKSKTTAICFDDLADNINAYYAENGKSPLFLLHENKSSMHTSQSILSFEAENVLRKKYAYDFYLYEQCKERGTVCLALID